MGEWMDYPGNGTPKNLWLTIGMPSLKRTMILRGVRRAGEQLYEASVMDERVCHGRQTLRRTYNQALMR